MKSGFFLRTRALSQRPLVRGTLVLTVTGLITAQDLIAQLKGRDLGEQLLLSNSMIRRDSDVFLDDLTISDVERELNVSIRTSASDGFELLDAIMGIEY